jgi:hypothetical protein
VLLSSTGESATVHSFSDERKPFADVPIGTVATAWVNPETSETFILVMNEALYFGDRLDHSLLCPNQLRAYGIMVNDTPRQFDAESNHSIMISGENVTIPLEMNGVISYFSSHKPSDTELENCQRLTISSDMPWNPNDPSFEAQERAASQRGLTISGVQRNGDMESRCPDADFVCFPSPPELWNDHERLSRMISAVNIEGGTSNGDMEGCRDGCGCTECNHEVSAMTIGNKRSVLTKEVLAK